MNHDERHFKWRTVTILTILQVELRTNDFILYSLGIMERGSHIIAHFFLEAIETDINPNCL